MCNGSEDIRHKLSIGMSFETVYSSWTLMTLECHVCIYFSCIYDCCRIFFKLAFDLRIVEMLGTILQLFSSFLDMVKWRKLRYQLSFLAPSLPRPCSVDYGVYTESIYCSWIDPQNCTGLVRESRHRWGLNLDHSFDKSVHNSLSWGEWINDLPVREFIVNSEDGLVLLALYTHIKCLEYLCFFSIVQFEDLLGKGV